MESAWTDSVSLSHRPLSVVRRARGEWPGLIGPALQMGQLCPDVSIANRTTSIGRHYLLTYLLRWDGYSSYRIPRV